MLLQSKQGSPKKSKLNGCYWGNFKTAHLKLIAIKWIKVVLYSVLNGLNHEDSAIK